jgi:putative ABC transport system substrate-binding protein
VEGRDVAIEYRWAEEQYDRLSALAAELVQRRVAVIAVGGAPLGPLAAKAATRTIPIVFAVGVDPVEAGLVASLNRPGGNLTGIHYLSTVLGPKRLEVLHQLAPMATVVAVLVNPSNPNAEPQVRDLQEAARTLGLQLHVLYASTEHDLEAAFEKLVQAQAGALVVGGDGFFNDRRKQLAALATRHTMPTIYQDREFAAAGGLASYGDNLAVGYRVAGTYVGRILRGEKPADLPIQQSTRVELVINLKTAKALGLTVPPTLLASANEVIE